MPLVQKQTQNQRVNKKILSIGEFASNLNADDFMSDSNRAIIKDVAMDDPYELTVE